MSLKRSNIINIRADCYIPHFAEMDWLYHCPTQSSLSAVCNLPVWEAETARANWKLWPKWPKWPTGRAQNCHAIDLGKAQCQNYLVTGCDWHCRLRCVTEHHCCYFFPLRNLDNLVGNKLIQQIEKCVSTF